MIIISVLKFSYQGNFQDNNSQVFGCREAEAVFGC